MSAGLLRRMPCRAMAKKGLMASEPCRSFGSSKLIRAFNGRPMGLDLSPGRLPSLAAPFLIGCERSFSSSPTRWSAIPIGSETLSQTAASALGDGTMVDTATVALANHIASQGVPGGATYIGELASLGLANNTPAGMIQQLLEWMSVDIGVPWWQAIVAATVTMRLLIMPLALQTMRNNTILSNLKPEMDELQARMKACHEKQDLAGGQREMMKLRELFKKNNASPLKSLTMPLVQMPLFFSFFIGIRAMANLPLESMKTGGVLWFPDLTVADPYYILPVVSGLTMLACLELGTEGVKNSQQPAGMKNLFRLMTVGFIPLMAKFPSALFMYWASNNLLSLSQVALLKIPLMRRWFNMPERIEHPLTLATTSQPGFVDGINMGMGLGSATEPPQATNKPRGVPIRPRSPRRRSHRQV